MYKIVMFFLAIVKFIVMPFRLWFLKETHTPKGAASPEPSKNDNSKK
jgi:hypothetical protein